MTVEKMERLARGLAEYMTDIADEGMLRDNYFEDRLSWLQDCSAEELQEIADEYEYTENEE